MKMRPGAESPCSVKTAVAPILIPAAIVHRAPIAANGHASVNGQAIRPLVLALGHGAAVAVLAPRLHLAAAALGVDAPAGIILRVAGVSAGLWH